MTYNNQFKNTYTYLLLAIAIILPCFSAKAQQLNARKDGTLIEQIDQVNNAQQSRDMISELLDYAHQFRGVPYRYGSMSPRAFDCSGFTSYVFNHFGIKLDRTSRGQIHNGRRVARSEIQPGDLVFFSGRSAGNRIGHVGLVTKVDGDGHGFNFIHAATRTGITVSHIDETYYARRFMGACRVLE
ncbi:MAG: C40 family peptidase [Muribaculaceae bacterium]|jgi:cell wall-associated NlpC family hydrolase|nr:C40 family peptidase [Muribaculaceae bacterium]